MKYFLLLLLISHTLIFAQTNKLTGIVNDAETLKPLEYANITVLNSDYGTVTNSDGKFNISGKFSNEDILRISFVGYKTQEIQLKNSPTSNLIISLVSTEYKLNKIIVDGLIAKEGISPISFSKLTRKDIEDDYNLQDVPEYLSYLPSTTSYSEGGNGIGYNYLSIRGFDQRRISISVNGIPQNDPEDHNIYWLDMPDLLESTELVQVQRGAGAGVIGYPSIGGSINIITSPFSDKPKFELSTSMGSYNTKKYSAKFSSGLINEKYSVYAKLSKITSDGYRDNSWVDFNSYHVSAARYDEDITTQINFFGGPVSDGLAFYGIPKSFIKDKELRKINFVAPREIENFSQPHYELLNEFQISDKITLNTALFLVQGDGFFDYDGSWSIYYDDYFRLKNAGFGDQQPTNALIRAKVENTQWGFIPRLTWEHTNGNLVVGLEYRNHRSLHWGGIRFAENIPTDVPHDFKYYSYEGGNDIFNFFVNENYNVNDKLNILGELQVSYHKYKLFNEKYLSNDFSIDGLYFNPRLGLNYKFNNSTSSYLSYARVTREPRLKNYYDAAESSGGATPQFEEKNGIYNFDEPLVKPEVMNDIELGARYKNEMFSLNANLFYMLFNDEIVSKGQLDRFGQPITGNIDKTIHTGIEIEGTIKANKYVDLIFNASYSKNSINNGNNFIEYNIDDTTKAVSVVDLSDNSIGGFPELTMNAILKLKYKGLLGQFSGKFVGDYYSDNYDNKLKTLLNENPEFVSYTDNKVDSYFVLNILASYDLETNSFLNSARVFVQVNNVFDNLYAAYATGGDYFPAAERNFLVGVKLGL